MKFQKAPVTRLRNLGIPISHGQNKELGRTQHSVLVLIVFPAKIHSSGSVSYNTKVFSIDFFKTL